MNLRPFFFSLLLASPAFAQVEPVIDSLEVLEAEEEILYKEDTTTYVYYSLPSDVEYVPGDDDPDLLRERLSRLQKDITLTYNDRVHSFINYFTIRDREYTRMVMQRQQMFFPLFEKYLAQYGLPDELKYLSIIESGLNPKAISRARAVGLWQFMSATGRYYGLHNDWYIDDRMDPERSTEAACRYLKDLYNMFHNWELALAAYNTGPGNVKKAIRRSGYKKTFWEIYPYLPRETRSYVPQFIAIIYTMNYLPEHNFTEAEPEQLVRHDTLHVKRYLHFETFARLTDICLEDLQRLNPSIQRNAIPDLTRAYVLRIPAHTKATLELNRFAILDSASKVGRKELELLARNSEGSTYGRDRIVYRVKSGDVLGSIAMRHHVRVNDIKKWNNLRSNMIRTGQRLTIWIKQPTGAQAVAARNEVKPAATVQPIPASKTYVVQPGDTLWDISRKFDGLTIEKIKQFNNLSSSRIQPGQTLVIAL
jgi:membrane-bound lytic murein transglycosylase D